MSRHQHDLRFRFAAYGGFWGAVGATLAWLLYFALQKPVDVLIAAVIGAAFGRAVHWIKHYEETASAECRDGERQGHDTPDHHTAAHGGGIAMFVGGGVLSAAGLTCEQFFGNLFTELVVPFLVSLTTFFLAGALFAGWLFVPEGTAIGLREGLGRGAAAGVSVGLLLTGLYAAIGLKTSVGASLAWWLPIGVFLGLGVVLWNGLRAPVGALGVTAVLLSFLLASVPKVAVTLTRLGGPAAGAVQSLGNAVDATLVTPDMPATVWGLAAEAMAKHHKASKEGRSDDDAAAAPPAESPWGTALAQWLGCDPTGPTEEPSVEDSERALREAALESVLRERGESSASKGITVQPGLITGSPEALRRNRLGRELRNGIASGLVRSWLVLLGFGVGLSLASWSERRLRPVDYPNSQTRRNDLRFWRWTALLLLVSIVVAARAHRQQTGHVSPDQHQSASPQRMGTASALYILDSNRELRTPALGPTHWSMLATGVHEFEIDGDGTLYVLDGDGSCAPVPQARPSGSPSRASEPC